MAWVTTTLLLEQLADGDEQAWAQVVERFREPVMRFARKLAVPDSDAEDVAQETLVTFLGDYRRGRYQRERGRLSTWLFSIAVQKIRGRHRAADRLKLEVSAMTTVMSALPDDDELRATWDAQWERHVFEHCLRQVRAELKPATVRAFELVALEQRSPAEAAAATELSVNSVYVAKHRVLRRIQELREQYEDASL
jgi:RNA polymerase sigma-70 factor (ECF subfamily)